jgi:hypothetical protein
VLSKAEFSDSSNIINHEFGTHRADGPSPAT